MSKEESGSTFGCFSDFLILTSYFLIHFGIRGQILKTPRVIKPSNKSKPTLSLM